MSDEGVLVGPGDDNTLLLVLSATVGEGSTMSIEAGGVDEVIYLDLLGRTLASLGEQEKRTYMFSRAQAERLMNTLAVALT